MCIFGDKSQILEQIVVPKSEALTGYRNWRVNSRDPRALLSESREYEWLVEPTATNPTEDNEEGYYNYYNYNYNYNYYILGKSSIWGRVIVYKDGYRSEFSAPSELVILDDIWFENPKKLLKADEFAEHFNSVIAELAKKYGAKVTKSSEFK